MYVSACTFILFNIFKKKAIILSLIYISIRLSASIYIIIFELLFFRRGKWDRSHENSKEKSHHDERTCINLFYNHHIESC
jgi:hypothetical protein